MRLANVKTRSETGLDYVMQGVNVSTPYGKKLTKELVPFMPGQENELEDEFYKVEKLLNLVHDKPRTVELLLEVFMDMKDAGFTIERSKRNALSVVELFEIKSLLLKMKKIKELLTDASEYVSKELILEDTTELLDILDPRKDRLDTFYIYDDFSEKLGELRKKKREFELKSRKAQKIIKKDIEVKYGIALTPKFDYLVSKSNTHLLGIVKEIPELILDDEDYMTATFTLKPTDEVYEMMKEIESLNEIIEEEETVIREMLSKHIDHYSTVLKSNCEKIGKLDFTLSKAIYADKHRCIKPEIVKEHVLFIEEGRHLVVEDILISKNKEYCPVSISLGDGVTCITGANMGGKTVSLKLVGLVAILTQYGFFVPCEKARVGLSNYIHILIGDSQSMERGLSSFGSEMEELKEMLDNSKDRTLLLIDEIASGTNPVEGLALTKSLVSYLKVRPYISLITTHFETVTSDVSVQNMQVMGLANADFSKLEKEIRYANRKERINIISKYMDYRLHLVDHEKEIPKDALNIAKMLGIYDEIIDHAKTLIN